MQSHKLLRFFLPLVASIAGFVPLSAQQVPTLPNPVIDIGSRRELFVDRFLVDQLIGQAQLRLHRPVPREIVMLHDAPWEGSASAFHTILKEGDLYRMYYRGKQFTFSQGKLIQDEHPDFTCYAESKDGIHWTKPELGLHEFQGSKANNIILVDGSHRVASNFTPFLDTRPGTPKAERFKALGGASLAHRGSADGLLAYVSADGIQWKLFHDKAVITDYGPKNGLDSQNLAFWDAERGEYRAYWRVSLDVRSIGTATSKDFLQWEKRTDLSYADSPNEHLYTNGIEPYHRAPHLFLGFPARYIERGWSDSMRALPELEHRELRAKATGAGARPERLGTALTEGLFMASRDGVKFKRWNEAFLPPGPEREGTWNYGHQYMAWRLVETKSALTGAPNELSLYALESYWTGTANALRRYTLRLDGFVSAQAPMSGGELITKPLTFKGTKLALNFATSAAGTLRVEIQDVNGKALPGFTLDECSPLFGDTIERIVTWKNGGVSSLVGIPVRLRFVLQDADVYAFQFTP